MSNKIILLDKVTEFYTDLCQCMISIKGNKSVSSYKRNNHTDLKNINNYFINLGFRHIKVRTYNVKRSNYSYYTIGTEKCDLLYVFNDIIYRYNNYKSVKEKIRQGFVKFADDEICACLNMIYCILSELEVFTVHLDDIFNITDEERAMYEENHILQYNNMFIPFIKSKTKLYSKEEKNIQQDSICKLFDYLFTMYYEKCPLEWIEIGECRKKEYTVWGLKLKEKNIMLSDFAQMLADEKFISMLYIKKYGPKKSYLEEALKCIYYLASGLEFIDAK